MVSDATKHGAGENSMFMPVCHAWCLMLPSMAQVRTAWKVWRTWSNGGGETGLRFDDSNVQTKLAPGLVDSEKVSLSCLPFTTLFSCLLFAVSSP